ncbi:hypothetical protein C8Q79DRAFT_996983 [Trametes meyenii]|nr:hypothetical protein C8Q79DRAFT_996983 [Trametes meyenii]
MPKKRRVQRASRESSEEPQFVVEVIKAARLVRAGVSREGTYPFRVYWANYPSDDDTWEPEGHLEDNCKRLLDSFWDDVGVDDEDYFEGYNVQATPSWIKKEKKLFARSLVGAASSIGEESDDLKASTSRIKDPPVKKEPSTSKGRPKITLKIPPTKKRVRTPKAVPKEERKKDHAENPDDNPSLNNPRKGKKRPKLASIPDDEADDDDDDDRPLAVSGKSKPMIPRRAPASTPSMPLAAKRPSAEQQVPQDDSSSESAGSLFSEKESSPEVALGTTSANTSSVPKDAIVPMKRPSMDDSVPAHRRKRQVMKMPMVITDTAGNSTKARLAQRELQPTAPSTAASGPHTTSQKFDLSNFKIKKKSATAAGTSPAQTDNPTIPALPRRSTSIPDNVQSPTSMDLPAPTMDHPLPFMPHPSSDVRRTSIPLPRRAQFQQQQQRNDSMAEANAFLSNIMPQEMAAPMREESTSETPTTPNVSAPSIKKPALPRIGKKWRWQGEMFMDVSHERAERVCEVTLHDPTDPLPNGLRFNICLKGDSIRLSALHDIAALPLFLDACARAQQFAKVGPHEDKDGSAVKELATYMMRRSFFCYAHLYVEETSAALLIIFPAGHPLAVKHLKVLPGSAGDALLQAALVPWELKARDFANVHWQARTSISTGPSLDPAFLPMLDAAGRKVVTQRQFYQALHILGFPKTLYDFMVVPNHPYCIWYAPGDLTASGPGYETRLLKEILATCTSKDAGYKADVRVVFVHASAVSNLYRLPALADRRAKRAELRFVVYGTHPSVPCERWGVREIYPLGGIVTFTPTAILQGHYRIFQHINRIAEHPLWECYVLPSVVAMVAKYSCQGMNPLQVYDEGNFVYKDLLKAIEDGSLAVLQAPQLPRDPPAQANPALLWTRWQIRLAGLDARGILEDCLNVAAEQFANTSEADLPMAVEKEIARDLWHMQTQPVIMDNYRRFVVFKTKQDAFFVEDGKYGIECTSVDKFDFKDDFFKPLEASNDSDKK